MGTVAKDTRRDNEISVPSLEEIQAGADMLFAPRVEERFSQPVPLTKDAQKGEDVYYAIGRSGAAIMVERRGPYGVSAPMALGSLVNHVPEVFDDFDPHILASLTTADLK